MTPLLMLRDYFAVLGLPLGREARFSDTREIQCANRWQHFFISKQKGYLNPSEPFADIGGWLRCA